MDKIYLISFCLEGQLPSIWHNLSLHFTPNSTYFHLWFFFLSKLFLKYCILASTNGPVVTEILLFFPPLLKYRPYMCWSPYGTALNLLELLKIRALGSVTPRDSSFRTPGCRLSAPLDLNALSSLSFPSTLNCGNFHFHMLIPLAV